MQTSQELHSDGILLRRAYRWRRAGWALLLVAGALMASMAVLRSHSDMVLALLGGIVLAATGLVLLRTAERKPGTTQIGQPGVLRLDEQRLVVTLDTGRHVFATDRIESGWIEEGLAHHSVILRMGNGTELAARFDMLRRAEAEAVLHAAGADRKAAAMRLHAGSARRSLFGTIALPLGVSLVPVVLALLFVRADGVVHEWSRNVMLLGAIASPLLACAVLAKLLLSTTTVTIGSDGIWIRRRFRAKRFVTFEQLDVIRRDAAMVYFEADDQVIRIRCQHHLAARALVARVDTARGQREAAAGAIVLADLDRAGRSLSVWRDELGRLLEHHAGYRHFALRREDLLRIVDNPSCAAERRVGAALALAPAATIGERRRMFVSAGACAHDPLRIALTEAAEGKLDTKAITAATADDGPDPSPVAGHPTAAPALPH